MNKTILVPIDFSANSLSATKYACHLAQSRAFNIHLFHCYTSNTSVFDNEDVETQNESELLKADILMTEMVTALESDFPHVTFTFKCIRGLIDEKLPIEAKTGDYELIVMGSKGSSAKKSIYWGSTTVAITAKSPIPVMVIPEDHTYFNPKRISLLTKFRPEELETLRAYIFLIGGADELTLTHVYRETADRDEVFNKLNSWEFTIREMGIVKNTHVLSDHILKSDINLDTVPEVVNKLIDESSPDVVLITKTRKSFFQRLFIPSVSKALTLELKKPAFFDKIDES